MGHSSWIPHPRSHRRHIYGRGAAPEPARPTAATGRAFAAEGGRWPPGDGSAAMPAVGQKRRRDGARAAASPPPPPAPRILALSPAQLAVATTNLRCDVTKQAQAVALILRDEGEAEVRRRIAVLAMQAARARARRRGMLDRALGHLSRGALDAEVALSETLLCSSVACAAAAMAYRPDRLERVARARDPVDPALPRADQEEENAPFAKRRPSPAPACPRPRLPAPADVARVGL